tara:strand:- start:248 stop:463 length:216 start_codon:yes stop_codon:yes gene_type:complete
MMSASSRILFSQTIKHFLVRKEREVDPLIVEDEVDHVYDREKKEFLKERGQVIAKIAALMDDLTCISSDYL